MSDRLLICGSRDLPLVHFDYIITCVKRIQHSRKIECIIQGGAAGADYLGKEAAKKLKISWEDTEFKVSDEEWKIKGGIAGPERNSRMIEVAKPTICLAFICKPLEESRGTLDCVTKCRDIPIICCVQRLWVEY